MRELALLAIVAAMFVACGQQSPSTARHSPSASASGAATVSPSSSAGASPSPIALTGNFGLLLSAGTLYMFRPDASVGGAVALANPSVQYCSSAHDGAILAPPVSSSNSSVYFRDGDTRIRMVQPPSGAVDVTTVPGGPTTISFFSVSPDDQRIAVLVEDLSPATTANLRLYVEDLRSGGHHADIYTTSTPKGKGGSTLWPMGWHDGMLVLAVVPICTFEPAGVTPSEWHVSDAATAVRKATIKGSCILSYWPSPAGVACVTASGLQARIYDWTGKLTVLAPAQPDDLQSGMSPSGRSIFYATGQGIGAPPPATRMVNLGPGPIARLDGHSACLWIDEDHLLAPDAVLSFPSASPCQCTVSASSTPLVASGVCAGRFPGGL
jgi:hypothetical protein